jgi:hypothetical protein
LYFGDEPRVRRIGIGLGAANRCVERLFGTNHNFPEAFKSSYNPLKRFKTIRDPLGRIGPGRPSEGAERYKCYKCV